MYSILYNIYYTLCLLYYIIVCTILYIIIIYAIFHRYKRLREVVGKNRIIFSSCPEYNSSYTPEIK